MEFSNLAKAFIFTGMFFLLLGFVLLVGGKIPFIGSLPGDILLESGKTKLQTILPACHLHPLIASCFPSSSGS
jgi:hypothetical protein